MKKEKAILIVSSVVLLTTAYFIWKKRRTVLFAKSLIGQTEISGNMGFNDPEFQKLMEGVNWKPGDQWCVYLSKVVWVNKFKSIKDILMRLISGNSQITYSNFSNDKSGLFEVTKIPKPGDIVIWQYYNNSGIPEERGHAGVVAKVNIDGTFKTVEGNTSPTKFDPNGYIVAAKVHSISEFNKATGLRLKGFIRYKYA